MCYKNRGKPGFFMDSKMPYCDNMHYHSVRRKDRERGVGSCVYCGSELHYIDGHWWTHDVVNLDGTFNTEWREPQSEVCDDFIFPDVNDLIDTFNYVGSMQEVIGMLGHYVVYASEIDKVKPHLKPKGLKLFERYLERYGFEKNL